MVDLDDTSDDILLVLDADTVEDPAKVLLVVDARLLVLSDAKIDLQAFSACAALRPGIVDSDLGLMVHVSVERVKSRHLCCNSLCNVKSAK